MSMRILSPAEKLPLEIIPEILKFHVTENFEPPERLLLVCRSWHAAALMTRELWGYILLLLENHHARFDTKKTYPQYQVCCTSAQVKRAVQRAARVPLDLCVVWSDSEHTSWGRTIQRVDKIIPLVKTIEWKAFVPRLRSLTMEAEDHLIWMNLPDDVFGLWDFSRLEVLKTSNERLLDKAMQDSRHLSRLKIPGISLKYIKSNKFPASIRHLHIFKMHMTVLRLSEITQLVSLELTGDLMQGAPRDTLLQLQELYLHGCAPFWPIDCPNLLRLRLHPKVTSYVGYEPAEIISLPLLRELEYISSSQLSLLRFFHAPQLVTLDIQEKGYRKQETYDALNEIWPPSPLSTGVEQTQLRP
ncbi:hypothetical protein PIIN_02304 [Serendipita indica DSM 11827]|uniref:F-box domain-containing protein n=1 Tax=Serendipita indica (strain DSM 11827) TaxID=1109443 RepID=G4TAV6_SERID|nr:hypothetical protein PIIN_02304 [Serendipita indica DSM 11827]